MHQRTVVKGIVTHGDRRLVLRRANGRLSILSKFEVPGGKIDEGEQPEDAIRRHVFSETGIMLKHSSLIDVLTYADPDFAEVQYVFIVFKLELENDDSMRLSENYSEYKWISSEEIQQIDLTQSSKLLLTIADHSIGNSQTVVTDTPTNEIVLYTDGGSRGNPGPSSAGYVIQDMAGKVLESGGEFLGITTNNVAEYQAALLGLQHAKALNVTRVNFRLDSQMVVNQMKGIFKIRNRELWPVHEKIKALEREFTKVSYTHVPREQNTLADAQVNAILNQHQAK